MMTTKTTTKPLTSAINAVQAYRASLMQTLHDTKVAALLRVSRARPRNRALFNAYVRGYWFDHPEVMAIDANINWTWSMERELLATQRIFSAGEPGQSANPSSPAGKWRNYCIERNRDDPLTVGHLTQAVLRAGPGEIRSEPLAIFITTDEYGTRPWSAVQASQKTAELSATLCQAIDDAGSGKPPSINMPQFARDLHQLLDETRREALRAIASSLYMNGEDRAAIGSVITAKNRFVLLYIERTLSACRDSSKALAAQEQAEAEVRRWLSAGTGLLPNLMDNTIWALCSLCAMSKNTSRSANINASNEATILAKQTDPLKEMLGNTAIDFARRQPEDSDFFRWLQQQSHAGEEKLA
jgi:hypothetical protein